MLVVVIVFFLILGVQVFFLVQDARKTLTKANKVLEETGSITETVSTRVSGFSNLFGTLATGTAVAKILKMVVTAVASEDKKGRRSDDGE